MNENKTKSSLGAAQQVVSDIKSSATELNSAAPQASYGYTDSSCHTRCVMEASFTNYLNLIHSFSANFDRDIENINVIAQEYNDLDEEMKLNASQNF